MHELGSFDERFKRLKFHKGMNILLADKTKESELGDSRNGAGKTSFVRILRYLFGGNIDKSLKSESLASHSFWVKLELDENVGTTVVQRPISPRDKIVVGETTMTVAEWKNDLSQQFGLLENTDRPTVGQLFGQLIRNYFSDPLKTYHAEAKWESGLRIGYFLGFSPEILVKVGEISAMEKQQRDLKKLISEGVIESVVLNESELRAELAQARQRRNRLKANLARFRVDEQYGEHQTRADQLSSAIRDLNDQGLALEQRQRDLKLAIETERPAVRERDLGNQLEAMYEEIGIVLSDVVTLRYDEVSEFHASIVRNRELYLKSELALVAQRLNGIESERAKLDQRRAEVMNLLENSMALETFHSVERELLKADADVLEMERKLERLQLFADRGLRLGALKSEAEANLRTEIADREAFLDELIVLFQQLGEEIYNDRNISLLIEAKKGGVLAVNPKIDGDASAGILGVKTFLLDIICVVAAIKVARAPRLLVHDSQLFDSMDDRQVASCLLIGARVAAEMGFQYVVTLNSDRLIAAEAEGFNRKNYVIEPTLTDVGEDGGLFGFRFV